MLNYLGLLVCYGWLASGAGAHCPTRLISGFARPVAASRPFCNALTGSPEAPPLAEQQVGPTFRKRPSATMKQREARLKATAKQLGLDTAWLHSLQRKARSNQEKAIYEGKLKAQRKKAVAYLRARKNFRQDSAALHKTPPAPSTAAAAVVPAQAAMAPRRAKATLRSHTALTNPGGGAQVARQATAHPAIGAAKAPPKNHKAASLKPLLLFASVLLLGFAVLGILIAALVRAPVIIPFRNRLNRVGLLLGGALTLLLLCGRFLGPLGGSMLSVFCLAGLGAIAAGLLYHRLRQPKELP